MSADSKPVDVTFWGTRGSIATPGAGTEKYGGNTACVALTYGGTQLILDAGTGIRNLGAALMAARNGPDPHTPRYHLLLSHTHWDHIQGLPFFAPAYVPGTELTIYGIARRERFLQKILQGQMDENYFPVQMKTLSADVHIREIGPGALHIDDITIQVEPQRFHPGGTVRFRIECGGRRIVYATDVELNACDAAADGDTPAAARDRAAYAAFIEGADLLIGDGQYSETEYEAKAGWGHTSVPVLIRTAAAASVRRLAVFHHDPDHTDAMLDRFQETYAPGGRGPAGPESVFWAREGLTVRL